MNLRGGQKNGILVYDLRNDSLLNENSASRICVSKYVMRGNGVARLVETLR